MHTELNSRNFEAEVTNFKGTVVIDFWAPWCGPCRSQSPILESFSAEVPTVKVCKVNTDENSDLATQFGIMSIPTIMVFKNGTLTTRAVGVQSISNLKNLTK